MIVESTRLIARIAFVWIAVLFGQTIKGDQASRAMRIAALGMYCYTSTCDLLTGWSLPALQGAQGSREVSSWGKLPT